VCIAIQQAVIMNVGLLMGKVYTLKLYSLVQVSYTICSITVEKYFMSLIIEIVSSSSIRWISFVCLGECTQESLRSCVSSFTDYKYTREHERICFKKRSFDKGRL